MRSALIIFLLFNISTCTHFFGFSQESTLTLIIKGSNQLETAIIDSISYNQTFTDLNSLKAVATATASTLIDKGYIDARLASLEKKDSTAYLGTINTGAHYRYINIHLPQNSDLQDFVQQAGIDVKENNIKVETAFAKALLEKLTNIAANNGNPFASFQLTNISKTQKKTLEANLLFETEGKRVINSTVIKGYKKFPLSFLKRYAGITNGESFNKEKLLQQNSRLNALPFAKSIKEPEVLFRKDSTTVYFYLEQTNSNRFDGFLGFATDEASNNLRLDGYVDLQLTNNLNYGETFLLNYKSDGGDQSQLSTSIRLPYLFKSALGIEASLSLFRKDSTFSTTSQSAHLLYRISPAITAGIGYEGIQSENLQDISLMLDDTQDYTTSKFSIQGAYLLTQDNYFFPNKATFSIKSSLGNRRSTEKERQVGLLVNASTIINLNKNNSVYIQNNTRSLWSDNLLVNELYRFGGITSIRGFEENSIFANFVSTLNTEYRYVFNQSLYLHSVIDAGYFENRIDNKRLTLFSFGAGAGIRTKAGVLRIIFANGKNENENFDFNNTKLHFQLAIRF